MRSQPGQGINQFNLQGTVTYVPTIFGKEDITKTRVKFELQTLVPKTNRKEYYDCIAWGNLAVVIHDQLKPLMEVIVSGKMSNNIMRNQKGNIELKVREFWIIDDARVNWNAQPTSPGEVETDPIQNISNILNQCPSDLDPDMVEHFDCIIPPEDKPKNINTDTPNQDNPFGSPKQD